MEMSFDERIRQQFHISEQDLRSYSPLTLAYIGDAVYELVVRSIVVAKGNISPNHMNNISRGYVRAEAQAQMAEHLQEFLTEEEADYYRRGRNAKSATTAKNASISDYRRATGFETLMGYLYVAGREERMLELVREGMLWYDENRPKGPIKRSK